MSSTFSLHQVLMACMATGILVSILVTSIHAQWQLVPPNATVDSSMSRGTPGGGTGEQVLNAYKSRIEQLSLEVEKAKDSAPSSSSTERPAAITPVPSVASSKEVVVAGGAAQAFEDYIALHKKILAKDPSVQQRYIIGRWHATASRLHCSKVRLLIDAAPVVHSLPQLILKPR
jgi:hypothetical protein